MSKLEKAKALADEWAWQKQVSDENSYLCSYFDGTTPHELIEMWRTQKNREGKKLSPFEFEALVERWCAVFHEWPPFDDEDASTEEPEAPAAPDPTLPADDTMISQTEVARITGVSESTIKRMTLDGRFPMPLRLSPHRKGWPAREVKAWIEGLDAARRKVRT